MNQFCDDTYRQTARYRTQRRKYNEVDVMNLAATPNSAKTSPINQENPLQTRRQLRQVPPPVLLQDSVLHDVSHCRLRSPEITTVCSYKKEMDNKPTEKGKKFYCHTQQCNIPSKQNNLLRLKSYMFRLYETATIRLHFSATYQHSGEDTH